jgi:manganese transport protein
VKKVLGLTLGILTAIGGFVDIGDLVANALVGSRFGLSLVWATLLGVVGICAFAEMSGRVAAITQRGTFDLIRERLGPRFGLLNLGASMLVTLLTFAAEVGGVALALQLITGVNYLLLVPLVGLVVWFLVWRAKFSVLENGFGIAGLALIVFAVAVWQLSPSWGDLAHQLLPSSKPAHESTATYWYYAIALFGAAMTPYEVFFFSSGGVEDRWTESDINTERGNVLLGFPLGGLLSIAIAACASIVLLPRGIQVDTLGLVGLPVAVAGGKVALGFVLLGFVAATFGAAIETALSTGYSMAQYFGWQWGKYVRPRKAARFHLVVLVAVFAAVATVMTTVDPIKVTEYSIVFSAVALPLTYLPILVVANDPTYMGTHANGRFANVVGSLILIVIVLASVAAIPLMIITKAGQ